MISIAIVVLLGVGILWLGWRLVSAAEGEKLPRLLLGLLVGAALLRLVVGVFWYVALPELGHQTAAEQNGYVMSDAYNRDRTAWKLAQSTKPLWQAFGGYLKADQYGGLLWLSAAVYRYLGGSTHQPLQIVVLTASFSALAVLLVWAFVRRITSDPRRDSSPGWRSEARTAWLAAWAMALYPEAVLLGSSQMREAFIMPLVISAFYGLAMYHSKQSRQGVVWMFGGVLLCLPFTPPFTALLVGLLIVGFLILEVDLRNSSSVLRNRLSKSRYIWLVGIGLVGVVLLGSWLALQRFAPPEIQGPLAQFQWWIRKSADFQAYLSTRASGKLQALFKRTPAWMHLPLLVGYGILQPFLPAALVVGSEAPIWQGIAIWRSAGWTILLVFLFYALLRAWRRQPGQPAQNWPGILVIIAWLGTLIASFRGGGDQWDNPRYRVSLAGIQIALAAWAWTEQRRRVDPWFHRAVAVVVWVLIWFLPYYVQREFQIGWPVNDLFKTIGAGLACSALYFLWDWARSTGQPMSPMQQNEL